MCGKSEQPASCSLQITFYFFPFPTFQTVSNHFPTSMDTWKTINRISLANFGKRKQEGNPIQASFGTKVKKTSPKLQAFQTLFKVQKPNHFTKVIFTLGMSLQRAIHILREKLNFHLPLKSYFFGFFVFLTLGWMRLSFQLIKTII